MLFDDAGPVSAHNSTVCRVWYSLLGTGSERETRVLLCTGLKYDEGEDRSWQVILEHFERLAGPTEPGTWGGILLFVGADLDYVCNELGLPHYNSVEMCVLCEAHTRLRPHNNFHADAAWRSTLVSNARFRERLRRPLHPLVDHCLCSKYTYKFGLLHMTDHHGVASHVVGNRMWAQSIDRSIGYMK